ncbi:MAG: hypothetical protein V1787_02760 [Candidatus Micrarchaeota archaeon]
MAQLDTAIDRLVEYVKLKNGTSVVEASRALQMPVKDVEELADILAESGLINVKYEFSGIRLTPKLAMPADAKPSQAPPRRTTVLERFSGVEKELKGASDLFVFSEKDLSRRLEAVQAHFQEIERMSLTTEETEAMRRMAPALIIETRGFEEKVGALKARAALLEAEVEAFRKLLDEDAPRRRGIVHRVRAAISGVASGLRRRKA